MRTTRNQRTRAWNALSDGARYDFEGQLIKDFEHAIYLLKRLTVLEPQSLVGIEARRFIGSQWDSIYQTPIPTECTDPDAPHPATPCPTSRGLCNCCEGDQY